MKSRFEDMNVIRETFMEIQLRKEIWIKNRNPNSTSNGSKLHLDKPTGINLLNLSSCKTGV